MGIKEKVKKMPLLCGVYIMKSKAGKVLYIGKASSLKKRVSSYFFHNSSVKTNMLMEEAANIDYIECETSEQALILEAALIKEKKPKYNISLRDDKTYPHIEVTKERFARIFISRPKKKSNNFLFGPYPHAKPLKPALDMIRRIFPYRTCRIVPKSACLFFHLKLCQAPCVNEISVSAYKSNIDSICKILRGERRSLIRELKRKMMKLALEKKFEEAGEVRDKILAIENLYRGKPKKHEIISLKEVLNLPRIPLLIEAIDISSLGKQDCVGSVVVFRDGVLDKTSYRRFLIKQANRKDDYDMIGEVVRRRYSRVIRKKCKLADLIIVDGGKGHVVRAYHELNELIKGRRLKSLLIGIAKRDEEIWLADKKNPLRIPKNSSSLHLIQQLRDEAHRFAHAYQLVRRKKRLVKSRQDD